MHNLVLTDLQLVAEFALTAVMVDSDLRGDQDVDHRPIRSALSSAENSENETSEEEEQHAGGDAGRVHAVHPDPVRSEPGGEGAHQPDDPVLAGDVAVVAARAVAAATGQPERRAGEDDGAAPTLLDHQRR